MRKIFSLFAGMLVALAVNAAVINISPTSPQEADNLRLALNGAATGDTIVMAAGTYVESPSDYIAFTGKEVTVMAAEGAEVILQPKVPIRLKEGAVATFINIKFDCGHLSDVNSYENLIVPADDTEGKTVILSGCEFYGWTQVAAIIRSTTSRRLSAVTIDKCYFHDVMKSCLFLENTAEATVAITNSTFANVATSDSYSAGVIDIRATAGSLNVNQCTFYNVLAMNTDFAAVGKVKLTSGAAVSNCIFAMPTEAASSVRTIRDVVAATNILVYNYTADSGYGMQSNVTKTNCVIADPLFVDAANGNFTLGEGSPALTMNDGAPIGDPRWVPAEPQDEPITLYLKLSEGEGNWASWPAKYAIYYFKGDNNGWSDFMTALPDSATVYVGTIPAEYADAQIIFVRLNGNATTPNWDDKWSQTENLTLEEGKDCFVVTTGGTGSNCNGTWVKYGEAPEPYVPQYEDGYYLVGNIGGVQSWDPKAEWKLSRNEGAQEVEEYMITITLAEGDALKVIKSESDNYIWYPNNMGDLVIGADKAGEATIYFRPDGQGGSDFYGGYIYVAVTPSGIDNTNATVQAVKRFENGMLLIEKNGRTYNAQGAEVK